MDKPYRHVVLPLVSLVLMLLGIGLFVSQNRHPQLTTSQAAPLATSPQIVALQNDTSSVFAGILTAHSKGITPIVRIGIHMDSGGFSNPIDYINFLKYLDTQITQPVLVLAGPNEPETERWVAPSCADGDGLCIGPYVAKYMNSIILGAGKLNHVKLLSPVFNLCSDRYPLLWSGMKTANPNWSGLHGLAVNVYDYTPRPPPYERISTCILDRVNRQQLPPSLPIFITETGAASRNYDQFQAEIDKVLSPSFLGGRVAGALLFNAFGSNSDPAWSWAKLSDATILAFCGNNCRSKKLGVNFATTYTQGDYSHAQNLGMPFSLEILTNNSTTPKTTLLSSLGDGQIITQGILKLTSDFSTLPNISYINLLVDDKLAKTLRPTQGNSLLTSPQDLYFNLLPYGHGLHKLAIQTVDHVGVISTSTEKYLYTKTNSTSLKPFTKITEISNGIIKGCAVDVDNPSLSIQIGIKIDSPWLLGQNFSFQLPANLATADSTTCGYAGNHGFTWTIPASYKNGQPHTAYIYGLDLSGASYHSQAINSPSTFTFSSPTSPIPSPTLPSSPSGLPTQPPPLPCPTGGCVTPTPIPTLPASPTTCNIRGFKVGYWADQRTINFHNSSYSWSQSIGAGVNQFSLTAPAGLIYSYGQSTSQLDEGFTMCTNSATCHLLPPTRNYWPSFTCPAGGYVDFWFHYRLDASPLPTVNLSVNGNSTEISTQRGNSVTLSWNSSGATSCTAISDLETWKGNLATTGSVTKIINTTGKHDFALTCYNGQASTTKWVRVNGLNPPTPTPCPPLGSPSGLKVTCTGMNSFTLSWNAASNATSYNLRVDDGNPAYKTATTNIANNCANGITHDICINNLASRSINIQTTGASRYTWWLHPVNSTCGQSGSPVYGPAISCYPTPIP